MEGSIDEIMANDSLAIFLGIGGYRLKKIKEQIIHLLAKDSVKKLEGDIKKLIDDGDIGKARKLLSDDNGILSPKIFNGFDRRITYLDNCRKKGGGNISASKTCVSRRAQQGRR